MGLELTYTHPDFPDGYPFTIAGIGVVPNGETVEVGEEQERAFIAQFRKSVPDAFEGSNNVELGGTAVIADASDMFPDEISDRVSQDPTAMNLTLDGERFEHANLSGAVSEFEVTPVAEELPEEEESPEETTSLNPPDEPGGEE